MENVIVRFQFAHSVPLLLCPFEPLRNLFMQNKPNVKDAQINVNSYMNSIYEKLDTWLSGKNKPNSNPIKANLRKAKINVKSLAKKSGHTPAYTVRQLFDIVVLYKYHLPIINPFTPYIRMTK